MSRPISRFPLPTSGNGLAERLREIYQQLRRNRPIPSPTVTTRETPDGTVIETKARQGSGDSSVPRWG